MKKVFAALVLFLSMAIPAFSSIYAVNGDNLPLNDEEFTQKSDLFLENYDYSKSWQYEWKFEKSKEQVASEVKEFCDYLGKIKKASYDVKLLRLIAMRCLYNVDGISSEEVKNYADQLKKKYKDDYRTWWIYGNFLSTTTANGAAFEEFQTALEKANYYVNRTFMDSYIYACIISSNVKHGWLALQATAEMDQIPIEEEYYYSLLRSSLTVPSLTETYDKDHTWRIKPTKDGNYSVFSTLAGIGLPVHGDWGLNYFGFEKGQTAVSITPPKFKAKDGTDIGVSFLMIACAREDGYETLSSIVQGRVSEPLIPTKKTINDVEFEVFEIEDLTMYNDVRGGHRGIFIIAQIPYSETSGVHLESSETFPLKKTDDESNETKFYAVNPVFDRIPETVTVMLMLDSCNAIYDASSKWFWDFVDNCVFE